MQASSSLDTIEAGYELSQPECGFLKCRKRSYLRLSYLWSQCWMIRLLGQNLTNIHSYIRSLLYPHLASLTAAPTPLSTVRDLVMLLSSRTSKLEVSSVSLEKVPVQVCIADKKNFED